jgi:hypothetical protein
MAISHPRRQQLRRLQRALARGAQAALALAGALVLAQNGAVMLAIAVAILGAALLADGTRCLRLADRSRVGAASEECVRAALAPLRSEGWWVRHGVSWPCGGDVDHVVRSPAGMGFAIETKTRRYDRGHLERTTATARWLLRRHRRYPLGVVPVLCVVHGRSLATTDHGVLVVTLDRLLEVLRHMPRAPSIGAFRPR